MSLNVTKVLCYSYLNGKIWSFGPSNIKLSVNYFGGHKFENKFFKKQFNRLELLCFSSLKNEIFFTRKIG